ncbi:MAG: DegV family protein [Clostridia bacterium]|jgi:DegV family protein with EDD domain|nr:DegV family protein [Clostridia bacterium]
MIRFIVDSTFGVTREFAKENGIKIVRLTLLLDGREFVEGDREDWSVFYGESARSKGVAKTSQPSPRMFQDAIDEVYAEDENAEILILTIGDRLSGTIGSANIAALQYPDKKLTVMDSHNAGPSALMFLEELVRASRDGMDYQAVIDYALEIRDRFSTKFVPVSLTELARGGRVNKLISHIGNILNIKPVFEYKANDLNILTKALGVKRAMQYAVDSVPDEFERLWVLYINDDGLVEQLKDRLFKRFGMAHIDVEPMCPVGGVHIGVGTVGIVTFEKEKKA